MQQRRSKRQMAKNIRRKVSGDVISSTIDNEVKANAQVAASVQVLSETIEVWSATTGDSLDSLRMALLMIPESMQDMMRQQEKVFAELVHASALLSAEAEKEEDEDKKEAMLAGAAQLRDRAHDIHGKIDTRPQSFKEAYAKERLGLRPQDVREKGIIRSLFSTSREILTHSFAKRKTTDELIEESRNKIVNGEIVERPEFNNASGSIEKMDIGDAIDLGRAARGSGKRLEGPRNRKRGYNIRGGGGAGILNAGRRNARSSSKLSDSLLQSLLGEVQAISRHLASRRVPGSSLPLSKNHAELIKRERQQNITDASFLSDLTPDRVAQEHKAKVVEASATRTQPLRMNSDAEKTPNERFGNAFGGVGSLMGGTARAASRALPFLGGAAAVGGAAVAGLAIGDQFNTSIEDGGSGNLKDVWDYNISKKSKIEKKADARADAEAQKRGYANAAAWTAANRAKAQANKSTSATQIEGTMQRASSGDSVERAQDVAERTVETKQLQQTAIIAASAKQPPMQQTVTNTKTKGNPLEHFIPSVRPADNSFQRFQDKRNSRVL